LRLLRKRQKGRYWILDPKELKIQNEKLKKCNKGIGYPSRDNLKIF